MTGTVVYGAPELKPEQKMCMRCGMVRNRWSWWAPMFRVNGDRPLGDACADCHTLPGAP